MANWLARYATQMEDWKVPDQALILESCSLPAKKRIKALKELGLGD